MSRAQAESSMYYSALPYGRLLRTNVRPASPKLDLACRLESMCWACKVYGLHALHAMVCMVSAGIYIYRVYTYIYIHIRFIYMHGIHTTYMAHTQHIQRHTHTHVNIYILYYIIYIHILYIYYMYYIYTHTRAPKLY